MGKYVLQRVDIGSAFKVGAVLYGLFSAVIGLFVIAFYGLIFGLGFASLGVNTFAYSSSSYYYGGGLDGAGLAALCIAAACGYLISIITGVITGGLMAALLAFFYNLTVRWFGGLQLEFASLGAVTTKYPTSAAMYAEIERDLKA
jgi:hypothetical protein